VAAGESLKGGKVNAFRVTGLVLFIVAVFAAGWVLRGGGGTDTAVAQQNVRLADFKCYQALGGGNPPNVVDLTTQFGFEDDVQVNEAEVICTVTEKIVVSGPTFREPPQAEHLKCYNIPGTRADAPNVTVETETQFGTETFTVGPPKLLCVPSTKEVITP
jgi:hypothetical protein